MKNSHLPFLSACLLMSSAAPALHAQASSFPHGSADDDKAALAIVYDLEAERPNPHVAADLDWENAFGIRYTDLKKRDAFYGTVVTPQFAKADASTLEIKLKYIAPDVAIADAYWHVAGQIYRDKTKPGPDRWGRTTYILKKQDGVWTEVMERVADLRAPYFTHYDTLPAATPVPATTLASYAGTYAGDGKKMAISVSGDHLTLKSLTSNNAFTDVIPISATQFQAFDPDDLAEYFVLSFANNKQGHQSLTIAYPGGEVLHVLTKVGP